MFYSRFDEAAGVYDLFQDNAQRAVNADLPVPDMPAELNGIGAPASECGRPLPNGAVHVGQTWSPKGIVVTPKPRGGALSLGEAATSGGVPFLVKLALPPAALVAGALLYFWGSSKSKILPVGLMVGGGIGTAYIAWWGTRPYSGGT